MSLDHSLLGRCPTQKLGDNEELCCLIDDGLGKEFAILVLRISSSETPPGIRPVRLPIQVCTSSQVIYQSTVIIGMRFGHLSSTRIAQAKM
jgi:hypothetical protein